MKQQKENKEFFAALDVGSDKVLCLVARPGDEPEMLRVIGIGNTPSSGIRNGCVVDVTAAVGSIRQAVREAGFTAGVEITGVWAAIGGHTLKSANCTGQTVLRGREVTREDVEQAELNARQSALRDMKGESLLKLIPQGYRCGDLVTDKPVGLVGQKLEADVHALYGSRTNANNLKHAIQRVGLELINYEPHPWAAAQAVLSEPEKTCGTALIDIGAETTSLIVFREGRILFTDVRPWGAEHFTRDLAIVLGISLEDAEALKLRSGECRLSQVLPGEIVQIEVHGRTTRPYARDLLVKTLSSRVRQFFGIYRKMLADAGVLDQVELVVLTGGGAMLRGIGEEAEAILDKHVRIGIPDRVEGESPLLQRSDAAVAAGLAVCALKESLSGPERAFGMRRSMSFLGGLKTFFLGDY